MTLTPKNWDTFQHYKDRAPAWIKLHRGLLDNIDFHRLSPEAGKALPLVWLIASERDGMIPEAAELSFRLRLSEELSSDILAELTERGFLISITDAKPAEQGATLAQRTAKANGFGSRHISDVTKRAVWERDGGKCCSCGSNKNIEYDHKHPVSKGGNSEESNIQLLCRPCNRAKRVRVATPAQHQRSLEKENIEKRREEPSSAKRTSGSEDFENLKQAYPKRSGNYGWKAAERKFNALVKTGVDPKAIVAAASRLRETLKAKIGTEFIPMPASWLNSEDFVEAAVSSFEPAIPEKMSWDDALNSYKRTGHWSRYAPASDIGHAPPDLLAKHGLMPDGRRVQ